MAPIRDSMSRPAAPLSLDLDDKWSYLQTYGDESWHDYPSYLGSVVPRILEILANMRLRLTCFVVGQDAAFAQNSDVLGAIASHGHRIGNHSFHHEPWLHLYSRQQLRADLEKSHETISAATGTAPEGFRGPGFSLSTPTLEELRRLGYTYDATVFPNVLNPLGRAYFFMRSDLTRDERQQRKVLYGTLRNAIQPNVPFTWDLQTGQLMEVPVTTMPALRLPFHFSYLLYLARFSPAVATTYLRMGLRLCRIRGVAPSLLLHPLDFMGKEDDADLRFFPGMDMPRGQKLELVQRFLEELGRWYELGPIEDYLPTLHATKSRSLHSKELHA